MINDILTNKSYKKAYVEITNICNLDCFFCPKTNRQARLMSASEFEIVLDKVFPFTDHIYFHLMGEPLLHPDFDLFVSMAKEKGFYINLVTNGVLAEKLKGETLAKLRKITFSLHSYEANNPTVSLSEYLAPIIEIAKNPPCIIELRLWNGGGKNTKNKEVYAILSEKLSLPLELFNNKNVQIMQKGGQKLLENLYLTYADKFFWRPTASPLPNTTETSKVYCRGLIDQFGVLADGTIVPCCLDGDGALSLGNIFATPLADILSSGMANTLRSGFQNRSTANPICSACDYAKRFN